MSGNNKSSVEPAELEQEKLLLVVALAKGPSRATNFIKVRRPAAWIEPAIGPMKWNRYGSFFGKPERSGIGGVSRDS
ncbi:hypothetical protein NC651_038019 [Populus alba x Populus x berolinensis]|nr:hypothetical protein NC651_038019 [Populus alba x Populus x berolinensis]